MPGYELIDENERIAVNSVFETGGVLFRHGFEKLRKKYFVREFENDFAEYLSTDKCLAVSSGTAALRIAIAALGIPKGSEIITTAFTFVATVEAIVEAGCVPVIVNVDETLTIDVSKISEAISEKTRAIIAVHMLGSPCDVYGLNAVCSDNDLYLIEDVAWGLGGEYDGLKLGTFGDVGCFSFDHAKALTTGEGGMLAFKSTLSFEKAAAWHDHGHENNSAVPRWEDTRSSSGFNFRLTELQGALGSVQLSKLDILISSQRKFFEFVSDECSKTTKFEVKTENRYGLPTYDAVILDAGDALRAAQFRHHLVEQGFSTKILPEAITWHYAGDWKHIPEIRYNIDVDSARDFLSKFVALPSFYLPPNGYFEAIGEAING